MPYKGIITTTLTVFSTEDVKGMARLPAPGGDNGTWGVILNDFLSQAHAAGGELLANTVGTTQLSDGSVTVAKILNAGAANSVAVLNSSGVLPDAQLPSRLGSSQLAAAYAPLAAGLTSGGSTGQLLRKNTGVSYDASWVNPGFANVAVTTGSEARPTASFVMWVGGTTQPTNMAVGDVWMKAV